MIAITNSCRTADTTVLEETFSPKKVKNQGDTLKIKTTESDTTTEDSKDPPIKDKQDW